MVFAIKLRYTKGRMLGIINRISSNVPAGTEKGNLKYAKILVNKMRKIIRQESKYHGQTPGRLASSISLMKLANGGINIYSMAPYSRYVEEGTRPHFIPFGLGKIEGVEHPGARAMRFADRALRTTKPIYVKTINDGVRKAIRRSIK